MGQAIWPLWQAPQYLLQDLLPVYFVMPELNTESSMEDLVPLTYPMKPMGEDDRSDSRFNGTIIRYKVTLFSAHRRWG